MYTTIVRVCRTWFTHSTPLIWDTVEFHDAIRMLSPLDDDGTFQQPLNSQSWDRFFLYSKHVCFLKCFAIKYTTIEQMIHSQPSMHLFTSKLKSLRWRGKGEDIEGLFPFLTSALKTLDLLLLVEQERTADVLFKTIALRSPFLNAFQMNISSSVENYTTISSALCELMPCLSQLISVILPVRFMTPELLRIVSQHPNVGTLKIFKQKIQHLAPYHQKTFKRKITSEENPNDLSPFHALKTLHIFEEKNLLLSQVFELRVPLSKLVNLVFSSEAEPLQMIALMELVHILCPSLQEIKIDNFKNKPGCFPWQAVLELLKSPYLRVLKVHRKIEMTLDNITTLATSRPFWTVIDFPVMEALSYQALIPFAQHCPKLRLLGLRLKEDKKLPAPGTYETGGRLPLLLTLNVGRSKITFPVQVGKFLSSICGTAFSIKTSNRNKKYFSSWKTVEEIVRLTNTTDQDEYYKEIPISEYFDSEREEDSQ
ncbi:hypothetical protein Clacol_004256 [Clathrus columnatus]|uniref:F-box domain-containing protein n=1 Tax=Clathrus columnatus TaxID=1419009 RepID=A0AAV5ADM9_9AGAM|nr:hypothetical protein Clacol_004256 [Clathrus columnatus]